MSPELLKVPLAIQIALVGGYLAYLLAYAGVRQHHTTSDAAFKSIVFSLAATAVLIAKPFVPYLNEVIAVLAAVACGIVWRLIGMRATQAVLRKAGLWADDLPNAWLTITALRSDVRPSQIAVDVEGGQTLVCDDTRPFKDAPYGPCIYGLDGSIAFYVTAERRADGKWFEHENVSNIDGHRLTYIPASAIKRVEIRNWTKATARVATVVDLDPGVEAEVEGS